MSAAFEANSSAAIFRGGRRLPSDPNFAGWRGSLRCKSTAGDGKNGACVTAAWSAMILISINVGFLKV